MKGAIRIENDLFGIANRLRSIDEGYFVVFNTKRGSFEVHNDRQRGSTFSLSIPYPSLDVRTVHLVQRTRAENAKRLFAEMEEANAALLKKEREAATKRAERETERLLIKGNGTE
ncbi:MAG: hypothetical protein K2M95_00220 [Clostridiales bacterium]|nr:hypothetical protein [Clostridiales bacterium]